MAFNPINHFMCFDTPKYLSSHSAWVEHIPFAFALMSLLRPNTFVELGAHYGDSYLAFCQAVQKLNLSTKCFAVDTWQGDEHAGLYGQEVLDQLRKHHDPEYAGFSRLVKSTFDDAVSHFNDGSIDLLHIDGMHSYEAVKHDFKTWLPKMSARGVMLFHDTNVRERDFGVWRFWEEVGLQYPHFEFLHGHGLGVLIIGKNISSEISEVLNASPEFKNAIRYFFSNLGWLLSNKIDLLHTQLQHALPAGVSNGLPGEPTQTARDRNSWLKLKDDFDALMIDRAKAQEIMDSQANELSSLHNNFKTLLNDRTKAQEIMESQANELTSLHDNFQALLSDRAKAEEIMESQTREISGLNKKAAELLVLMARQKPWIVRLAIYISRIRFFR